MSNVKSAKVGDEITLRGLDGKIVGVDKYASPGLNWAVWEVQLRGQEQHQWITRLKGRLYETSLSQPEVEDAVAELRDEGYRLARQGDAQREVTGPSERQFSRCQFIYYVAEDNSIALAITDRGRTQIFKGSPIDSALVELFPA